MATPATATAGSIGSIERVGDELLEFGFADDHTFSDKGVRIVLALLDGAPRRKRVQRSDPPRFLAGLDLISRLVRRESSTT